MTTLGELPGVVCAAAHRLLPAGALHNLIPERTEDWTEVEAALSADAAQRLRLHLAGLELGRIENLGALVYLHWALKPHDPSHRRPAWVEREIPSFRAAEAALGGVNLSPNHLTRELRAIYGEGYSGTPVPDIKATRITIPSCCQACEWCARPTRTSARRALDGEPPCSNHLKNR